MNYKRLQDIQAICQAMLISKFPKSLYKNFCQNSYQPFKLVVLRWDCHKSAEPSKEALGCNATIGADTLPVDPMRPSVDLEGNLATLFTFTSGQN